LLEGQTTLERVSASLEGWTPPSREAPSQSRAKRPIERVSVSLEGITARRPIPAPPAGAFNALTPAGIRVKGESMPLRTWESCPATAPPTPTARPSPPLCDAVRRGQPPPRGIVPPTPVRPAHRTLEKGQRNLRRDDAQLLCARTGWRRDIRPVGTVTSVAINPVRSPLSPQRHPDHCITILDAIEASGDGTPPRQPLCLVWPNVNDTLESPRGRPSNEQSLRHPLRSRSWRHTGHAVTPR
jgi:hypothetical protein